MMQIAKPVDGAIPFLVIYPDGQSAWGVRDNTYHIGIFYHYQHALDWINQNGRIPDAEMPADMGYWR